MVKKKPPQETIIKNRISRWLSEDGATLTGFKSDEIDWGWFVAAEGRTVAVFQPSKSPHLLVVEGSMAAPQDIQDSLLRLDRAILDALHRQITQWLCLARISYEGLRFPLDGFTLKRMLYQGELTRAGLMEEIIRVVHARTAVASMVGEKIGKPADAQIDFGEMN